MDESFINKVKLTVLEHIEDEMFNVGDLAYKMGFSSSQILRKIKASTGKSATQYIRIIRLKEAAKLIRKNDYTISEVSYKVGFGSPSYFNKCFHDYFELTPGEYKEQNEEEIQKIINRSDSVEPNFFKRPKVLFLVIIFLIAVLLTSFIIRRNLNRKDKLQNSIAVLYFDDMSSGSDTQWFCDGITDEIYTNLSKLKNLKVISRTSVKRYRNSDKAIPKIAKELGVSYLLEGTVKKYSDMFRITVKLINSNDETVWSQEYDGKIENVSKIQREVSKNIVQELQVSINPVEEKLFNTFPTDNKEAYECYLKARNFAERRTKKYLDLSIYHYQKAIDLDPNFADAYADMALTILNNRWVDPENWDVNKNKAVVLADLALKIDPNSAKAYSAKGKLNFLNHKPEKAIENFKRALELDPNDAIIHREIAFYYSRGYGKNMNKSLYHINKAVELDPFSPNINQRKIYILLHFHKMIEAEEFYNNKRNLFSEKINRDIKTYFSETEARMIALKKRDKMEIVKYFLKEIDKNPQNPSSNFDLGYAYKGILNDNDNYIKYTKIAYTLDSTDSGYAFMYSFALLEGGKFQESKKLINSENYKNVMNNQGQLNILTKYYYFKGDYDDALRMVNDNNNYMKAMILAQKGKVEDVREILKTNFFDDLEKIKVFALLKERDSMYYYINKVHLHSRLLDINGCKAIDPYRKEERYKEFLKKNYFPITHWNE